MAQDAIKLLKDDHEKVKGLLKELTETTSRAEKKRKKLLEEIGRELRVHAQLEEQIFYPAFRKAGKKEGEAMYHEAKEEHRAVEELVLPDLEETGVTTEEFTGRAKVLKELIEHHIQEEEKSMFPKAKKLLSSDQLKDLGAQMLELKSSLEEENVPGLRPAEMATP